MTWWMWALVGLAVWLLILLTVLSAVIAYKRADDNMRTFDDDV